VESFGGSRETGHARALPVTRERRQECQRFGSHASCQEDNAWRGESHGNVQPTEANCTDVESGNFLGGEGVQALDAPRTSEARVRVRGNVKWQKSV